MGLAAELNSSGWRKPCAEAYPAPALLARFHDHGVPITTPGLMATSWTTCPGGSAIWGDGESCRVLRGERLPGTETHATAALTRQKRSGHRAKRKSDTRRDPVTPPFCSTGPHLAVFWLTKRTPSSDSKSYSE